MIESPIFRRVLAAVIGCAIAAVVYPFLAFLMAQVTGSVLTSEHGVLVVILGAWGAPVVVLVAAVWAASGRLGTMTRAALRGLLSGCLALLLPLIVTVMA